MRDAQLDIADASGNIYYSTDHGSNWSQLHAFGHPVYWIATDPGNPNRMYASVVHYGGGGTSSQGGIWMTNNLNSLSASTWTHLPQPPRTEGHPASIQVLNDGKMVCTFSGRINPAGTFTASSGVFLYDPVAGTWTDVSDPAFYYWTKDIMTDPADLTQNTWYVGVFSGWGGAPNGKGGLFKTTNRGASWVKLTGSQFDRVTSMTFNPQNLSQAYLTTETQGLWVSQNMNTPAPAWSLVESYPFRQPERVFFNPYDDSEMWVTSFGNGMKRGSTNATGIDDHPAKMADVNVFPNPFSSLLYIVSAGNGESYSVYNCLGECVKAGKLNTGETTINTSGWKSGVYLVNLSGTRFKVIKY